MTTKSHMAPRASPSFTVKTSSLTLNRTELFLYAKKRHASDARPELITPVHPHTANYKHRPLACSQDWRALRIATQSKVTVHTCAQCTDTRMSKECLADADVRESCAKRPMQLNLLAKRNSRASKRRQADADAREPRPKRPTRFSF